MAMPIEPIKSSGFRPMRSMRKIASRQAAMDSVPLKILIFSESASLKPTACHSTAP